MKKATQFINEALATCFFLTFPIVALSRRQGRRMTGAGVVGTLAGVATVPLLPRQTDACLLALIGALLISVAVSDWAEESLGHKDDPRIVIDEWIGYLLSVALLPHSAKILGVAFVLFRVLDSWKPFGIRKAAQLPGGWGVVMDDVAAGLVVNAILRLLPLS